MTVAFVGLGSNLGDREANLRLALERLRAVPGVQMLAVSRWIETDPVGGPPQPRYLNGACALETDASPHALLARLHEIEDELGRVRTERWGPRTVDLDLLFWGDRVIDEAGLTVPHPRAHERLFVLAPLDEIAPDLVHPTLGRTIRELHLERRHAP